MSHPIKQKRAVFPLSVAGGAPPVSAICSSSSSSSECDRIIDEICRLQWQALPSDDLADVARAYYYFSVQFRENLEIAVALYPDDGRLQQLQAEECDTDNLSPWPGVALAGERLNHDEFVRRLLELSAIDAARRDRLTRTGRSYLDHLRKFPCRARAASIVSYEDGGLERVFAAMLQAEHWDGPLLPAFRHFLTEHIRFDSDPLRGHGALSRHLPIDRQTGEFWEAFKRLLLESVPRLAQ